MTDIFSPPNPAYNKRIAMIVEYDGADYFGWQIQKENVSSVQQVVTKAVSRIANHPVNLFCAGRTDTGVHASRQVIHFDTLSERKDYSWTAGTNTHLPRNVSIQATKKVNHQFHARFSALERRYRYVIYNHAIAPGLLRKNVTWFRWQLDAQIMHEAAQLLLGKQDFSTFRAADCQAASPIRTIKSIAVKRYGNMVVLDIRADGFLYHMVRNIIGVLLEIGQSRKPISWMTELLGYKDRTLGGVTAEASGLYFVDAIYDDAFELPETIPGPNFLSPFVEC